MAQCPLTRSHGLGEHLDHADVALQLGHVRIVHPAYADLGDQACDRREAHPRLAERRQDLLDVAQEQGVRSDDEHALALEWEAVRVEQVGRPVQRHSGLAGPRAALHDQDTRQGRADDLVLFPLDGRDDVAHVPGARLAEGREQRAGAAEQNPVAEEALASGGGVRYGRQRSGPVAVFRVDEVLVLQPEDRPAAHGQVPAPRQALGVEPGGTVERLGHRGAPIDDERFMVGARHRQPPDVERLTERTVGRRTVPGLGQAVDAAEIERLVADVELVEPSQARPHDDVALGAGLERAAPAEVQDTLQHLASLAPHELQPVVGTVQVVLLILQIRMFGHLSPFSPVRGNRPV